MEGAFTGGGTTGPGATEPAQSLPPLQPLSFGQTLDTAVRLYRDNAVALWTIVACVIVPLQIIQVIVRRISLPSDVFVYHGSLYTFTTTGSSGTSGTVALLLVALLGLFGQLLSTGAVFKLLLDAYEGQASSWRHSFEFAGHRVFSLLWLGILATVLIALGFVLFVFPGIWLIVATSVAVPALMLEGVTGFKAIKCSIALVDKRWWATFGRLLTAFALYAGVTFVIAAIVEALTRGLSVSNVTLWLAIDGLLRAVVIIFMTPFIAAVITVIYIDLRVRKEGFHLAAATTPEAPAAPPWPAAG